MELISREAAINAITGWETEPTDEELKRVIINLPAIEDRKEGSWIPINSYSAFSGDEETWEAHGNPIAYHYCSKCKNQVNVNEFGEELLTNYCPYCGAKMKGE